MKIGNTESCPCILWNSVQFEIQSVGKRIMNNNNNNDDNNNKLISICMETA